jgi:predicted acetyltransferase
VGEPTVRTLASDDDIRDGLRCLYTAFLVPKDLNDEAYQWVLDRWDRTRAWGAFDDDGALCGTARTFASRLRLPGLTDVPVSCLTSVTVLPTHTRQGHLNRMMRAHLEHAVEQGEVASLLVAAEWPIYGRYGYGPYCEWSEWEVDVKRAAVLGEPYGWCRLVDAPALEKAATTVLARQQAVTPGSIERPPWFIATTTGADPRPDDKHEGRVRVVHYDADGEPDAYAQYDPKERWDGMRYRTKLQVEDMVAASREAERELWRYLIDVDLVEEVRCPGPPESALRWSLADGRMARVEGRWDHIWARPLDVPACLEARSYASPGRVVLEVIDDFLDRGGRFVLDASPDGASCRPTTSESAAVTLDVSALGAAWVGGTDLRELAVSPRWRIDEHEAGALARLGALLRWHQVPYCSTDF